ncbi:alpha-tectorin-like isoform X1 [Ambystoma mexicanum]|uniref:alpha-tectorin-like isoform X1 n=1 Tax=Ambystoma mexicanum TaxID=8296 RepID=UPI0037E97BDB
MKSCQGFLLLALGLFVSLPPDVKGHHRMGLGLGLGAGGFQHARPPFLPGATPPFLPGAPPPFLPGAPPPFLGGGAGGFQPRPPPVLGGGAGMFGGFMGGGQGGGSWSGGGSSSGGGAGGAAGAGGGGGWSSSGMGAGGAAGGGGGWISSGGGGGGVLGGGVFGGSGGAGSDANVGSEAPASNLYPYGPSVGDKTTPKTDDGFSDRIKISQPFEFYGKKYDSLYVNNNGALSMGRPVSNYTPDAFPLANGSPFVAPFWGDVDVRLGGNVFYRECSDAPTLKRASDDITKYFPGISYKASWAFVATWDKVAYFGSRSNKVNTFQAVLTTNGKYFFIILIYHQILWTTGLASRGNALTGLGGMPAQCGFNSGDDSHYFNIPTSRTGDIVNIARTSNVDIPGVWAFRVDTFKAPGGCVSGVNFAKFGDIFWKDDSCEEKCTCQRSGDTNCVRSECTISQVCKPSKWYFLCDAPDFCI